MKTWLLTIILGTVLWADPIEVTIIYGNDKPDKVVNAEYAEGMSALELLEKVSRVETSQSGPFTFVRSIDGVQSVIGKYGWFYMINGEATHKMAQNYLLKDVMSMTWVYRVEACY